MKKAILLTIICGFVLLCGCSSWMNGSYASVTPHKEQNLHPEQVLEAPRNYKDLVNILSNMVLGAQQKKTISMDKMRGDWQTYVLDAVEYVCNEYPMGAYAVLDIDYEITETDDKPALVVDIIYRRSMAEIGGVMQVDTQNEIEEILHSALRFFDVNVALSFKEYKDIDFMKIIRDYAVLYPQYVMELPRVSVMMYPQEGQERIVELIFSYNTSRTTLRQMQQQVDLIFSASEIYVSGAGEDIDKYAQLYSFLMNRYDYTLSSSITPAYSLLHQGMGDSKAFATVYAAMCRQAGLNCQTVMGTRGGQLWYWNVMEMDDVTYHIDLLRCRETGRFFYKTAQEMTEYKWDEAVN